MNQQPLQAVELVPAVSVIIPVFNREKFIAETVGSVLSQTFRDFEILAIDDGSTDRSRAVLESFGDRVHVLEHPCRQNRGQSAAINVGLGAARGRYIAVLDSDDLWMPEKLEVLVSFLDDHPDADLVYSNGIWVDEAGKRLGRMYPDSHHETSDPSRVLLDCYFALPSNALVRRRAYDKAGHFDESLRTAQDHDMAIRLAEVARIAYVGRVLWAYRRHPESVSKRSGMRRWHNGMLILEKAAKRYPYPPSVVRQRRAVLNFRMGQLCIEEQNWLKAGAHLATAGLLDPIRALRVILGRETVSSPHS